MADEQKSPTEVDSSLIETLCDQDESLRFETKLVSGKMVHKALETIVAFANTDGGVLLLGMEDFKKASKRDRLVGIQANPEAVDELRQKVIHQITPPIEGVRWKELSCVLRSGQSGEMILIETPKSRKIHSIVGNGTWKRLAKGNRQMTAEEITALSFTRGVVSAETDLIDVPIALLATDPWKVYCEHRRITTGDIGDRMMRIGLARRKTGDILPTRAAVLLFADDPSGLLAGKAAVRVFHYAGLKVEHGAIPNLLKTPKTFTGPLIKQISDTYDFVVNEIASGLTLAPSGFETVHRYPTRVIREAITNAVIHRDYRLNMSKGKRGAFYRKTGADQTFAPFMLLSEPTDNKVSD